MSLGNKKKWTDVEQIKDKSRYLRGTIEESINDELTNSISAFDQQLVKFHGTYQQFDRAVEVERRKKKLEPNYTFMIRVRLPGGITTAQQWLTIDQLTGQYGIGTIKITTRQAYELHGVLKKNLKKAMQGINDAMMDTLAACGDVNRNVMAGACPFYAKVHTQMNEVVQKIHKHLTPQTTAYQEIWLNNKKVNDPMKDNEPLYGKNYLPRKFKIALAIPPNNDTDIFAHDIGLAGIVENGELVGFNVSLGGGMGQTFGRPETRSCVGHFVGFIPKEKVVDVCEKVLLIQRDNGDRTNRKQARLKYTIARMGADVFKKKLEDALGFTFEKSRACEFKTNGDLFGWQKGDDGKWHCGLFVEGGRVKDTEEYPLRTGLREIAKVHKGYFILTANQNLMIADVAEADKAAIEKLLDKYGIAAHQDISALRAHSIACVALNLCPLAFAEGETYLPSLISKIDEVLAELGLKQDPITIRMTGCPNGCARPFISEIGLVGKAKGKYNLYLGGSLTGNRLNILYKETLGEEEILNELRTIFTQYAKEREASETFGDFVLRKKIV